MSRYTVQYGTIYESGFQPLISLLASYPIFDETHRAELNQKIYDRYRFREIGFETAAVFAHYFGTLLREIMPMYNQFYETVALQYPIIEDMDYSEAEDTASSSQSSGTSNSNGTSTTTDSNSASNTHAHSDTPQGSFNFSTIAQNEYLSDASRDESSGSGTSQTQDYNTGATSASGSGELHKVKRVHGKTGGRSYADLVMEYRKAIMNIDVMILDELNVCFMGIY